MAKAVVAAEARKGRPAMTAPEICEQPTISTSPEAITCPCLVEVPYPYPDGEGSRMGTEECGARRPFTRFVDAAYRWLPGYWVCVVDQQLGGAGPPVVLYQRPANENG